MAASWKSSGAITSLGKRFVKQIWTAISPPSPSPAAALLLRRGAHTSVYDKNIDYQVCPSVVPDELIEPQSDKYWAPHPQTGVFGPATEQHSAAGSERGFRSSPANIVEGSVLEETAWFRPTGLEDLEKPHHLHP